MKALLAFSGGGGSGFPGAPIAGVYTTATTPEFLSVCAEVLAVQYSFVVDAGAGGLVWYSNGSLMILLGGSVLDQGSYPYPGTAGGVTFYIAIDGVAIFNNDTGLLYRFNGDDWIQLS